MKFALLTLSPKPLLASVPFIFPTLSVPSLPTLHLLMSCFYYAFPLWELYCRDFWLLWMIWNLRSVAGHSVDAQNILFAIKYKSKQPWSFVWHRPAHRGTGRGGIGTGNLQVLCFPFVPLADRWCSTNRRPAPDTTFGNHRKQVPAQAAACVQHPLPVPGSRPPTNVWCKYYLCPQFPSFWEFRELIILRWNILVG